MSSIAVAMSSQGYKFSHPAGRCQNCTHMANLEGPRCQLGHFWVRPACGCDRFADRLPAVTPAPAARPLIQIGPTDV
jgi:hypothetical protein